MAALIGHCLMESGAADKITRQFIRWLGEKYSSASMLVSGFVLSIPVFSDTVFYLLALGFPIPEGTARRVSMRGRGERTTRSWTGVF
jgi:H+/gluconate symporter-like permease